MKSSRILLSSVLLFAAAVANAATPLFSEYFSGNAGDWSSSSGAASFDNQGWNCTSTCKSQSAIKLGTGSATGSATSPSIAITTGWSRASVTVSFQAAAWYGTKNCTTTLSAIENNLTTTNVSWSVPPIAGTKNDALQIADLSTFTADANEKNYEVTFEARGPFQLLFETSGSEKRLYLDTVIVTAEEIVSVLPPLYPPLNLVTNALSQTGFSVAWDAVNGATGYVVRVDGAVVANCGPSERTASVSGCVAGSTHIVTVVAQADGTTHEDSPPAQITVDLPAWPAAVAPDPVESNVSSDSFTVSWTQRAGETYAVRAWTIGPVDTVSEGFEEYPDDEPDGWTFGNGNKSYKTDTPVQLGDNGASVESPLFSAALTGVSFKLKPNTASGSSSLSVEGSADGIAWSSLTNIAISGSTGFTVSFLIDTSSDIRKLRWTYTKDHGNVGFGKFVASGSGIGVGPAYLEGFGPVAANLGTTSTCTFEDPVAGKTHYVEVTATGLGDDTATTTIPVDVPDTADPWRPVWTVPGAVTAFVGKEIAFAVSAVLGNDTTQTVALASGPDGATFDPATGAFAWTPAATGATNAVFRVVNTGGEYTRAVPISVEDAVRTGTLFREDFSRFITKWKGSTDPAATPLPTPDEAGWTFSNASRATSALRIGKSGNKETSAGYAVSREIVLTNNLSAGTVSLSFEAAAQFSKTGAMRVFVLDAETDATVWMSPVLPLDPIEIGSPESTTLASVAEGVHTNAAFEVSNVPERFRLRFETEPGQGTTFDCRSYLDTIVVSQTWDASVPALAAPVPAIGEPGMDSLPVSWATVEGATGYDLEARLADGSLAARATGVTGTSHTFTDLADGTAYRVRIRSLGDGTNAANSPWSDPVTQTTVVNPDRPAFSVSAGADASVVAGAAKTFAVSAARGETIVPVSFGDLSPEPAVAGSVRFSGGTFSWTPTDDDAEKTFTATFRAGSYETNVVFAVTARPPLAAPTISTNSVTWKAASLFWNEQPRATEYAVRLWRGTADYTRAGACFEDFADLTMPKGWTGVGTGWYPSSSDKDSRVQFDATGDELISKLHSAPVTNLSFHLTLHGTGGENPSTVSLFASTGGAAEGDWHLVATYQMGAGQGGTKGISFSESNGYHRFKWSFTKTGGNAGLGNIEARHAGAGAKFVAGFGSIAKAQEWGLSTTLAADRLRPDTEYFLEVTATDGETSLSSTFRFRTLEANKATMMILR